MRSLVASPIGRLAVEADHDGVTAVRFGAAPDDVVDDVAPAGFLRSAAVELGAYFAGSLTDFTVPVVIRRGSDFERAVWAELARIPYGEMRTYGDIAKSLGDPGAARAVGTACNRNPVPVIVPCHRVVGAGGKLVGFGGGLPRKRHLLELEARVALQRAWS